MSGIYIALDLEATGMDPERDEIIEIAAIAFREDRVLDRWETLVRPSHPIPFSIATLTGIATKDVRRAPVFAAVAPRLREFVRNYPIVGQSPQFDIDMLAAAGLQLRNPLYDTFQLATILMPDLPAYNLSTIAARLGISVPSQHRAMADVETTMAVFLSLLDQLRTYDPTTLQRLATYARTAGSPLARLFSDIENEQQQEAGGMANSLAERLLAQGGGSAPGPEMMFLFDRERPARLEPTGRREPWDAGSLARWFGPGGAFARHFPHYEPRPQQAQMMDAVARTLNDGGTLLVEAGTGTGKSIAYLMPAILHAVERGERVVVSTNTIALQDQLVRKDLPDLRQALAGMAVEVPELEHAAQFDAAVLKGRANYLCLRRWFLAQREAVRQPEEASLHAKILTWLQQTETGDRAELHLSPDEQAFWGKLAEEEGACVPGRCVFHRRNQCFLFRARHLAESAHIVVVNHALLLSDMMASNTVIPPYTNLIIDEAHNLEEEATSQLGFTLSRARLVDFLHRSLAAETGPDLGGALGRLRQAVTRARDRVVRDAADELRDRLDTARTAVERARAQIDSGFQLLSAFAARHDEERSEYDHRLRLTPGLRHDPAWEDVEGAWDVLARSLRVVIQTLEWARGVVDALDDDELTEIDDLATELDALVRIGQQLVEQIQSTLVAPDPAMIHWLSQRPSTQEIAVHAAPLRVGGALREHLFDRCRSTVLTSATLTTNSEFGFIRDRLGIEDADELIVPSPFDYQRSTLLYLANDIPEPGQHGHARELHETIIDLCRTTRGHAMVLFTSHSALQAAYRAIKRPLEADGILVLGQRMDGSPRQLVDRLRSHPEAVLLGTNSFWEGVDIVGDALSLLVISKLPFSVPSDPVFAARGEEFDDPFHDYAIPQAILRFKQGFGRLIRSASDRGVCAVLDRRIASRRYGRSFVASLPTCTVEEGSAAALPDRAAAWLRVNRGEPVTR